MIVVYLSHDTFVNNNKNCGAVVVGGSRNTRIYNFLLVVSDTHNSTIEYA
jgi:hypothetical protein